MSAIILGNIFEIISRKFPCAEIKFYQMDDNYVYIHCEPKKHTQMFLSYLPQNPVDSDKIWYTLSSVNLRYNSLNVLQLT